MPSDAALPSLQNLMTGLEAAADATAAYIYLKDLEGRYTWVSQSVCDFFGKPRAHILGLDDTVLFDAAFARSLRQDDLQVLQGKTLDKVEQQVEASGRVRQYWTSKKPIRDEAGHIVGLCGISQDLTDHHQVQQALQDRESKLEAIIANSPSVLSLKMPDGRYALANPNLQRLLQRNESEIIGKTDFDLFPADIASIFRANDKRVLATRTRHVIEEQMPVDAGSRTYLSHMFPVFDEGGGVQYICRIALDVTERKTAHEALQQSEQRLRWFIEHAPAALAMFDRHMVYLAASRRWIRDNGLEGRDLLGQSHYAVFPHMPERWKLAHQQGLRGEVLSSTGERFRRADGTDQFVRWEVRPWFEAGETVGGIVIFTEDITERVKAETSLRIAATAFESQDGIMVTDARHRILRVNSAFTRITGYTEEEVVGKTPRLLKSGRQDACFYELMWNSIGDNDNWIGEIWNQRKNGEIYPELLSVTAVKDALGTVTHYVGTFVDISQRKKAEQEIEHLAFHDHLTSLPNRRMLMDRIAHAQSLSARSGSFGALLLLDLDNFKMLNDTLGHLMGDLLLQQVAQRLSHTLREGDTVARLGGDEFVVLLANLSDDSMTAAEEAGTVAGKIQQGFRNPFTLEHHLYPVSTSIGVTVFSGHRQAGDDLIQQADIALYQAKKAGRNTLRFFDWQVQETLNARATLESDLRHAFARHRLTLHYQVQVNEHGHPVGAEALLRWYDPDRGVVEPVTFVPLAEESGLILEIGAWVLERACLQLHAWQQHAATRHLVLSINVSPRQFHQPDFVKQVIRAVDRHGIDASKLKLELTESMLMEQIDRRVNEMNVLKMAQVGLSLDDFGTGFSSLSYLRKLPLDQLKIDQSFVRDVASDDNDRTIVSAIIAMARSLGLEVIAEGVETEVQRDFLLQEGCRCFQGFLFGRPQPPEAFEAHLRALLAVDRLPC